ncbi:SRPBCC family protein [Plantactinospora sp. B5E13]|uniref:SRPBCC family protein n=1 Tax=unclassified Plantactinospora TaxID=2631981 RepID=UPI00325E08D2
MARIELTTTVMADLESVFDACLDVDLHTRSMTGSRERAVAGVTTGRLGARDVVTWRARHCGVPWRMTVQVTEYQRPYRFVDEQLRGPFTRWWHEHTFTPDPSDPARTIMRDAIDFTAPVGVVGVLVARLGLSGYLSQLIARRNAFLATSLAT